MALNLSVSHRSLYFMHQPPREVVTRVEVRYYVACPTPDTARALQATAAAATVATFRDALVECVTGGAIADEVAHLWKVAEVVAVAAPQLVAGALSGVAGALWTRDLDLDEAKARPRVLAAAVAAALGVAAADVAISVRNAAHRGHARALELVPLISTELQSIPATDGVKVLDALGNMLDAHFAPPPSSEDDEDGDDAMAPAPLLPLDRERVHLKGAGLKRRLKTLVESLGGDVVGRANNPTLAIFPDNHTVSACHHDLSHLQPRCRVVRERWLLRVSTAAPLPDCRPDAVFARVRDVRDPESYFYGAVPDADLANRQDDDWKAIPEDWTPPA